MLDEHEDFFLFTYAKMLLHKRLRIERLLSSYAIPFYLITETRNVETDIKIEKVQDTKNITKEKIASALQVDIDTIKLNNKQNQIEEKWTEVNEGVRKNVIQKKQQEVKEEIVRRGENSFEALVIDIQDDKECESGEYESKEDQKYERIVRNEDTQTYDVNKMTSAELEKVIKE